MTTMLTWTTRREVAAQLREALLAGEGIPGAYSRDRIFQVFVSIASADELVEVAHEPRLADLGLVSKAHFLRGLFVRNVDLSVEDLRAGIDAMLDGRDQHALWFWCGPACQSLLTCIPEDQVVAFFQTTMSGLDTSLYAQLFLSLENAFYEHDAHHRAAPSHVLEALLQAWNDAVQEGEPGRLGWPNIVLNAFWWRRHPPEGHTALWASVVAHPEALVHLGLDAASLRRLYALEPDLLLKHAEQLLFEVPVLVELLGEKRLAERLLEGVARAEGGAVRPEAMREFQVLEAWSVGRRLLRELRGWGQLTKPLNAAVGKAWCRAEPVAARAWLMSLPAADPRAAFAAIRWPDADVHDAPEFWEWALAQEHMPHLQYLTLCQASRWVADTPSVRAVLGKLLHGDDARHRLQAAMLLASWNDRDGLRVVLATAREGSRSLATRFAFEWLLRHRATLSVPIFQHCVENTTAVRGALSLQLLELAGRGLAAADDPNAHTVLLRQALRRDDGLLVPLSVLAGQTPGFLDPT